MTGEEIKEREAVEHPLEKPEADREVWLVAYLAKAYTDQLGVQHSARVVFDRQIIHITAKAEQFEGYGQKWYDSGRIGFSRDGRKWKYYANLVDYSGGGSWYVIERKLACF